MRQETHTHQITSVVQQTTFAYVITPIGIVTPVLLKPIEGEQCGEQCRWGSQRFRSQAKFVGSFPF